MVLEPFAPHPDFSRDRVKLSKIGGIGKHVAIRGPVSAKFPSIVSKFVDIYGHEARPGFVLMPRAVRPDGARRFHYGYGCRGEFVPAAQALPIRWARKTESSRSLK